MFMDTFWKAFKFVLFLLPPERAHNFVLWLLKVFQYLPDTSFTMVNERRRNLLIGVAAGFDKNAEVYNGLYKLGFNTVEIGTVTPLPQKGNPKPRMFRMTQVSSLRNKMGFPNVGAEEVAKRLQKNPKYKNLTLGINIGKNKDTPLDLAYQDYGRCIKILEPYADYFTINVSSPNTPGLQTLQEPEELRKILTTCQTLTNKPLYVKISPGLTTIQLQDIVSLCLELSIQGIIATNTLEGISGEYLKTYSLETVKKVAELSNKKLTVVGVGGISSNKDVKEYLSSGANKIQVYTGLVYNGFHWINRNQ